MSKPLIALIGVSGSGKTTLANKVSKKYNYNVLKSYTTRKPRENDEADLSSHLFCTLEQARSMRDQIVCSNWFAGNFYYCTEEQLDNADIYVTDIKGLKDLLENYHNKPVISIFLEVDSSIAAERMERRGDDNEAIMKRLQHDSEAFKDALEYVNYVCNNENQDRCNDIVEFIHYLIEFYNGD